ncbi:hypothetical protein CALVIDRAFT_597710 [Calocera viscosa TUFC12733]|uniref:F-box domain-containing protein n=1 Tax=Calocera viscosa (strain TUFC12733) TaxID=1330018 RepID=A0A167N7B6_CALVF|nr:hypothetical protein CALVIDRAFT_597710 [Calocera viscosa TUFC12733]
MPDLQPSSPFDRLPPELISGIFELAVHSSKSTTPILCSVLGVCKRFHDISVATPILWTRLCLPLPQATFAIWLSRAHPHLLDIEIDPHPKYMSGEELIDLRRNLRDNNVMSRCRSLTVAKCAHFLVPDILCVPWSQLRILDVEFCTADDDFDCPLWDDEEAIDLLGGHPEKLRKLRLRELPFNWTQLPLRDVRVLEITMPSATWAMTLPTIQQFLDTLADLHQLEVLTLDNWTFDEVVNGVHVPFTIKRDVVNMPCLRKVMLCGPTLPHLRLFLPFIKPAPKCELHVNTGIEHLAEDIVIPLAPAFFSHIHSVSFYGLGDEWGEIIGLTSVEDDFFVIREADMLRALRQMPSLHLLNIEALRFSDSFLRHLTVHGDQSKSAVPQLEGLRFAGCHGFSEDALERMVQSRGGSGEAITVQLRCVLVEQCPNIGEGLPFLQGLEKNWKSMVLNDS